VKGERRRVAKGRPSEGESVVQEEEDSHRKRGRRSGATVKAAQFRRKTARPRWN